jgi:hypothetical protein
MSTDGWKWYRAEDGKVAVDNMDGVREDVRSGVKPRAGEHAIIPIAVIKKIAEENP